MNRRVLLHCNAGAEYGMGHLMRCLALADLAQDRGWDVEVIGEVDDAAHAAATRMYPAVPLRSHPLNQLDQGFRHALQERTDVVHLDSYWDVPDLATRDVLVSNMQDGTHGMRTADLAIDANLGAELTFAGANLSAARLAGIDAAVIRGQVLRQRSARPARNESPRVLVVMGGSDPTGLTSRVVAGLDRIADPIEVTVVDPLRRTGVEARAERSRHSCTVYGYVDDLPALARAHDLVISAAGTSTWDFACMGLPMALVCAVENQRAGYRAALRVGLARGLGEPPHVDLEGRVGELGRILDQSFLLHDESERSRRTVDGLGAWRIVATWEQLLETPIRDHRDHETALRARGATARDAAMLFAWRNDESTRSMSRTREPLDWADHVAWLERVLEDPDRRLLIIESGRDPVATIRWDRLDSDWSASITVAPDQRGRGLAPRALAVGEVALEVPRPHRLLADVHVDNIPSRRIFARSGYLPHLPADADGFLRVAKWRLT